MKAYMVLIGVACVLFGCGDTTHEAEEPLAVHTQEITGIQDYVLDEQLRAAALRSEAVPVLFTDKEKVKGSIDDYITALDVHFIGLGYDTNTLLSVEHTNYLANLSIEDFRYFLEDICKAFELRGARTNEYLLLKELMLKRIAAAETDYEWWHIHDAVLSIFYIDVDMPQDKMLLAERYFDGAYQQFKRSKDWLQLALAMARIGSHVESFSGDYQLQYADFALQKYDTIIAAYDTGDEDITDRLKLQAQLHQARLYYEMNNIEKALSIKNSIKDAYMEEHAQRPFLQKHFLITHEAMTKGLKGTELNTFFIERMRE